jgi:hypothetical protein
MSDARQSPIPQDRVNQNVDQPERAQVAKAEQRQLERERTRREEEQLPGSNPKEQPGIPDPDGPAEGGD